MSLYYSEHYSQRGRKDPVMEELKFLKIRQEELIKSINELKARKE
ncbi:MAG: hypothetical protein ABIA76_00930 [Candidatus Diapherotrites archaeon]